MGRPREHDDNTREALLDAAESLLASGGTDAVSVRGVASAIGVSTRAVYSVLGNKDGLIAALAVRGYAVLARAVRSIEATGDPVADLISVGATAFRQFALQRPHLYRLTFERVTSSVLENPEVGAAIQESASTLLYWIDKAQVAGVIDDRPALDIAFAFHSLCQGMAGGELATIESGFWNGLDPNSMEELWKSSLEALVRGMSAKASE